MGSVRDALGREVQFGDVAPTRVVSLVPSETETVVALVGLERLVGRTAYCEEPAGLVEAVPTVGGTKKLDPAKVIALAPDLVLANKEENGKADVEALIAAGLCVHVSMPISLDDVVATIERLGRLLHVDAASRCEALRAALGLAPPIEARVLVPIWKDPWMSFDARTYASDLLARAGAENVFAERQRRYPLAADLGSAAAIPVSAERDTRYPRFTLDEAIAQDPDLVLLPDEPYRFTADDRDELARLLPRARVELVSGKDLFWYGVRSACALERLRAIVRAQR